MIKLKNTAHFFVLSDWQQKEILSNSQILLERNDKTYYQVGEYIFLEEKKNINGKIRVTRSISESNTELLGDISLTEILLNSY